MQPGPGPQALVPWPEAGLKCLVLNEFMKSRIILSRTSQQSCSSW